MANNKHSRSKKERQIALEQEKRQKQLKVMLIGAIVLGLLYAIGYSVRNRNLGTEDLVLPSVLTAPANSEGSAWGAEDAPVLIEEFADFQCPFCGQFATSTAKQLEHKYADSGLVRFEYHHFPFIGPESIRAAQAAECAAEQDMFWPYHETIFLNQYGENLGTFTELKLASFANALDMDGDALLSCLRSGKYEEQVLADWATGQARGVNSTPSIFINGRLINGGYDINVLQQEIELILEK